MSEEFKNPNQSMEMDDARRRPGMFIGKLGQPALLHMATEMIGAAANAIIAAGATEVLVSLLNDGILRIEDNGDPLDFLYKTSKGEYRLDVELVHGLNAGFRSPVFPPFNEDTPTPLYPNEPIIVRALSEWFTITYRHEGDVWEERYEAGKLAGERTRVRAMVSGETEGVVVMLKPDLEVLKAIGLRFDYAEILSFIRNLAYLIPKGTFVLDDRRDNPQGERITLHYPEGIRACLRDLNSDTGVPTLTDIWSAKSSIQQHSPEYARGVVHIEIQMVLQYIASETSQQIIFLNNQPCMGGTASTGLIKGLQTYLTKIARDLSLIGNRERLTHADVTSGLNVVINIAHYDPAFWNSLKRDIANPELSSMVEQCIQNIFTVRSSQYLPRDLRRAVEHCVAVRQRRHLRLKRS
ncbi:MAG: hypothetical protein U0670_19110 [Anaerolineae bacterium]